MQSSRTADPLSRRPAVIIVILFLFFFFSASDATAEQLEPLPSVPTPEHNSQTPEKIELGRKLFFDRRLSGDGTISCASCHNPEKGFSDGREISLNYPTTRNWRNAPTLINVRFQKFLFHDGRAGTLEEQALFPMMSAFEMNRNLDFLEEVIRSVPEYVEAFKHVYGDADITRERIAMAIAAFERTLVSLNPPLDRYVKGDRKALSTDVKKGYEIFAGKGGCSKCHYGDSLSDHKFHALQVPENLEREEDIRVAATRRFVAKMYRYEDFRNLREDPGRYLITKDKKDWKAFKTPTLWEISGTGPYMHNGIFQSLDEVVEFFDQGGGKSNTELKPLNLSAKEKQLLRNFLIEALTGEPLDFQYPKVP